MTYLEKRLRKYDFSLHQRYSPFAVDTGSNSAADRRLYRPDERAVESGVYEILHDREHRSRQVVTIISGEIFPECETCKWSVRYGLVRSAAYIFHDGDFQQAESDT